MIPFYTKLVKSDKLLNLPKWCTVARDSDSVNELAHLSLLYTQEEHKRISSWLITER